MKMLALSFVLFSLLIKYILLNLFLRRGWRWWMRAFTQTEWFVRLTSDCQELLPLALSFLPSDARSDSGSLVSSHALFGHLFKRLRLARDVVLVPLVVLCIIVERLGIHAIWKNRVAIFHWLLAKFLVDFAEHAKDGAKSIVDLAEHAGDGQSFLFLFLFYLLPFFTYSCLWFC